MSASPQILPAPEVPPVCDAGSGRDDLLLARAREGDRAAFGELVRRHQRTVHSLAARMLCQRQEGEDLAQEVFLQLHRKLSQVRSGNHLVFWLRKVTLHRAIDRLRRRPRHEVASLDEVALEAGEAGSADPLLSRQLARLVGELHAQPRAVLLLRYQEDLDPTQIASTLGLSINTVKSHLRRSLAVLRERLGATREGEPASRTGMPKS